MSLGAVFCTPAAKTAGCPLAHTPLVDVIVNATEFPPTVLTVPAAVQLPADAQETAKKFPPGMVSSNPAAKTACCAVAHTPLVDVMVNAGLAPPTFEKPPTAVQLPADAHDTE
jgi:hypothetical protein